MMPNTITVSGTRYIKTNIDDWESGMSPLQRVLGIEASEQLYDTLPLREQIIVDLLMAGWNQTQIAKALGSSQPTISSDHKRIRYTLANSKLRVILEMRAER